jgi:hypothetical protein
MYVYVNMCMYVCMYILFMYVCISRAGIYICVCVCVCVYVCICMYVGIHIYIYIYIYTIYVCTYKECWCITSCATMCESEMVYVIRVDLNQYVNVHM